MHNALLHPKIWVPPKKSEDFDVQDIPDLTGKVGFRAHSFAVLAKKLIIWDHYVALVTGGTYDVGLEISKALASANARVVILSPDEDIATNALEDIRQHCRDMGEHSNLNVHAVVCDLASLADVKRVGDKICQQEERLDIVRTCATSSRTPTATH